MKNVYISSSHKGEGGYFRWPRNKDNYGGIANMASYPIIADENKRVSSAVPSRKNSATGSRTNSRTGYN